MSSTVNDILPTLVPELDVSGANWTIFSLCLQMVIQGKGLWGHFDGTSVCPVLTAMQATPTTTASTTVISTITSSTQTSQPSPAPSLIGTQDEINTWKRNRSIAYSLLGQQLPDATLVLMPPTSTVEAMWKAIVKEYTYKSVYLQAHLLSHLYSRVTPSLFSCNFLIHSKTH